MTLPMDTKKCGGPCGLSKPIEEFSKRYGKPQSWCKPCTRVRFNKYYQDNKEHHKTVTMARKAKQVKRAQDFVVDYLNSHPCADCGNDNIIVLDFDHTEDNKIKNVSELIDGGYSLDKIRVEINKCDVVCANCHRIRTAKRGNFYKYIASLS